MLKIGIVFGLLLSTTSFAMIDMKNANFSETWTDLIAPGTGYDLRVTRFYNSRSLFNGMFGFGWCSNFETSLDVTAEGNVKLIQCGDGQETLYFPKAFASNDVKKAIDIIVAAEKKSNPSISQKSMDSLKKTLESDPFIRSEYARKLNIKGDITEGTEFYSASGSVDVIARKKDFFLRSSPDGTSQRFDLKGQLLQVNDKNGNFLKFNYKGEVLTDLVDNNGRKLTFTYDAANGKVKEIKGPNNTVTTYKYKDVSNLIVAVTMDNITYAYEYDELHNMTEIKFPDGTKRVITYDKQKDWVMSYKERDGCVESYEYTPSQDDPKNHYTSTVTKKCGDRVTNRSKFEFWFKIREDKAGKFLQKVAMDINNDKTEIVYHELFGKPVSIKRNGRETVFTYFANGLVKTRQIGKELTNFAYDKRTNKVSQVSVGKRKTNFEYDGRGNLVLAKNSGGQIVKLTYDPLGRIKTIVDQAKRVVNITYDEKVGKPSFVERPGVGAINVSYKPNGEINKVESKDGPAIAVQVASSFNNLLEILAPAGVDLGL